MKATLEYNLEEVDDQMALKRAIKSIDMAICLFQINYNMRKQFENEDNYELVDRIFDKIHEEIMNNNINLDELIQ